MISNNDVTEALKVELWRYFGEAINKYQDAVYPKVFYPMDSPRETIKLGRMWGTGQWTRPGKFNPFPQRDPFEGAEQTVTPEPLGEERSFNYRTVQDVLAAGHDVMAAADNWAQMSVVSTDGYCADYIHDNKTIYDAQTLFATAHPRRSKTNDGGTYSNDYTPAGNVGITDDTVRDVLTLLVDTNAYGENGERLSIVPAYLLCSTYKQFLSARAVLQSVQQAGTINNDINVLRGLADPLFWGRLAQTGDPSKYWYACTAPMPNGLCSDEQQGVQIDTWQVPNPKTLKAVANKYFGAGCGDWRTIMRSKDLS